VFIDNQWQITSPSKSIDITRKVTGALSALAQNCSFQIALEKKMAKLPE
jgi:hypothetical protein